MALVKVRKPGQIESFWIYSAKHEQVFTLSKSFQKFNATTIMAFRL